MNTVITPICTTLEQASLLEVQFKIDFATKPLQLLVGNEFKLQQSIRLNI